MPVTVVVGAQWGDEGKGKVTDFLAQKADMVVRWNGGDNAGHTVGDFKLHLVPCGIFNPRAVCIIGNGVAVNPNALIEEIDSLEERGVSCQNLKISQKAHLNMPWHTILDGLQEEERGQGKIGTTKRGIGPVFADKIARFGMRAEDLILPGTGLQQKLMEVWRRAQKILSKVYDYQKDDMIYGYILRDFLRYSSRLHPYITETEPMIWEALERKKSVLLEGAQGTLLDPDFGTYPQTTSSSCTLPGALQGSGVSWRDITEVIGIVKAYTTRVCEKVHDFSTEMPEEIAGPFRKKHKEYGTTTGRDRRIGWLDIPKLKYAARINGFTSLAITRLDSIGFLPEINICIDYSKSGRSIYKSMPGWNTDIQDCRKFSKLPKNARKYVERIEELVGVKTSLISVGPKRDQTIVKG